LIFYSPTQYVLYKYKLTYVIYLIYLFIKFKCKFIKGKRI